MVKKFEREAAAVAAADGRDADGRRRLLTAKEMHRTLNHRQTERGPRPTRVDGRRSSIGGVQCGVCGRTSIKNLFAGGEIVEFILREREKIVAGENVITERSLLPRDREEPARYKAKKDDPTPLINMTLKADRY